MNQYLRPIRQVEKCDPDRQLARRGPDPADRTDLAWGAAEERIVVTIDKDFGQFLFTEHAPHKGLVRLPDVPSAERVAIMESLLSSYADALQAGSVLTVRGGRVRVSRSE
jgi:predicted nuclease of predicted toxin-antitoxin system